MEQVLSRKQKFETRVHELDFIRGVLIILVLIDHLLNNIASASYMGFMYNAASWYWNNPARWFVQDFVALPLFVFLSGISCMFSKNNWQRAGKMIIFWGILALGSNVLYAIGLNDIIGINLRVDFNIIGVIAWSNLIYCLFEKRTWKILATMCIVFFLFGSIVLPQIEKASIAAGHYDSAYVPALWYYNGGADQADRMTIYPYIIYFFLGAIFGRFYYSKQESLLPRKDWERPICFIGRHSLLFYIGHQIVYIPIFYVLRLIFG